MRQITHAVVAFFLLPNFAFCQDTCTVTINVTSPNPVGDLAPISGVNPWTWGSNYGLYLGDKFIGKFDANSTKTFTAKNIPAGKCKLKVIFRTLGMTGDWEKVDVDIHPNAVINLVAGLEEIPGTLDAKRRFETFQIVKINFSEQLKGEVFKSSPPIKLAKGTSRTVKDSQKIVRSTKSVNSLSKTKTLGIEWGAVDVGISTHLVASREFKFQREEEKERSVDVVGDGKTSIIVDWRYLYKTGSAEIMQNGKRETVQFRMLDDFDLVTRTAKKK